jgi:hypothetical protein
MHLRVWIGVLIGVMMMTVMMRLWKRGEWLSGVVAKMQKNQHWRAAQMRLFYTTRWRRLLITTPQFLNARKRVLGTYLHKAILVQPYYRTSLEVILFLPMCSVRRSPSFQRLATEHHQHHYIHVGNFASWKSAVRLTNMTAWARIRSLRTRNLRSSALRGQKMLKANQRERQLHEQHATRTRLRLV